MNFSKIQVFPKEHPLHVYPIEDTYPHDVENNVECKCKPSIKSEKDTLIIVHNAYDGRK